MGNMGYCRFENTLSDLFDCYDHMEDKKLSDDETAARREMVTLCRKIADDYGNLEEEE